MVLVLQSSGDRRHNGAKALPASSSTRSMVVAIHRRGVSSAISSKTIAKRVDEHMNKKALRTDVLFSVFHTGLDVRK